MLYLSSYMKSQQSDAKSHPLTVHIDNNQLNHHHHHQQQQQQRERNNNSIYQSPVKLNHQQHSSHQHKSNLHNTSSREEKSPELPPHLRHEQQLLSPIASSGNTLTGSVTGAIDSDYDVPPEERRILSSLSHSPSPANQPHLNQLNRLNYYQSYEGTGREYENLVKPKVQPAPVTRGALTGDVSNNKIGGTSCILQSMNQATRANLTEPTSHRPNMASHNSLYNQHTDSSSSNTAPRVSSGTSRHLYGCNDQLQHRVSDHTYTYESTRSPHTQQLNNFQSPVRGKLTAGHTIPQAPSSLYSTGKVSTAVSHHHPSHHLHHHQVQQSQAVPVSGRKYTSVETAVKTSTPSVAPVSRNMTDREQKELDQLLSDMYAELATFPNYSSTGARSTARSLSTSHHPSSTDKSIASPHIYKDGKLFNRSISHSPSVRNRPQVLHYNGQRSVQHDTDTLTRDTVDAGSVYATLVNSKDKCVKDNHSTNEVHSTVLPSSPSIYDGDGSRGMSIRSVTLTPTPVRPLFATQHSLVTSTPKPIVVTDTSTGQQVAPTFKGTHVLPGAKIGDQEAANRVGVYASTLGKKKLSSGERQELDDLINVMMEEVKNFPDYSSTKHYTNRDDSTYNRLGYHNGSISNLEEVGIEATPTPGVASTRAVFENTIHQQSQETRRASPSPSNRSRSSYFGRSDRDKSYFSSGPTRTASISPVRHFNRANSVVSARSISTGRYPDRTSLGTTVSTMRAPSAASMLTASLNPPYGTAGGVLAQPSTEPLPPHLLTRPTEWCKDERSRPYHARADSRPFTYGVTAASPLIQRRRVHSESTAYVVENRPRAHPDVDYNEPRRTAAMTNGRSSHAAPSNSSHTSNSYSAGLTRGLVKSPGISGNIYDDPSELEREMDAISEVSVHSGDTLTGANDGRKSASDTAGASWLEKQQIKLKEKKDNSDTTYQEQKGKSRAMLNELTRTMSGSRVPGYNEVLADTADTSSSPPVPVAPSPPKSRLIERLNLVNGNSSAPRTSNNDKSLNYLSSNDDYYDECASSPPPPPLTSSTSYTRAGSPSKGKSVTLLTEDGEIVDTEGRPATPGRPVSQQSGHHQLTSFTAGPTPRLSSSPTRYASYLHNNNQSSDHWTSSEHDANYTHGDTGAAVQQQPSSPIYASVNLMDKHRMASTSHDDKH